MRIFEFYFNPKLQEDKIFKSFYFEPENAQEKKLGTLIMAGELTNILPQNSKFLDNLATVIKEEYYLNPHFSAETSFIKSLKKANEFLFKEGKKENISWLGNLSFVITAVEGSNLNFIKVGKIKLLFLKNNEITDIGESPEFSKSESYSFKIFRNFASGKIEPSDKLFIASPEIAEEMLNKNLFERINEIGEFKEKQLREIIKKNEKAFNKTSGMAVFIGFQDKDPETKGFFERLGLGPAPENARLAKKPADKSPKNAALLLIKNALYSFKNSLSNIESLSLPSFRRREKSEAISSPLMPPLGKTIRSRKAADLNNLIKKNLILFFALILILAAGFFVFNRGKNKETALIDNNMLKIQEKNQQAENALIFKDYKKANLLFAEAYNELIPVIQNQKYVALKEKAAALKEKIEKNLFNLNKLEKIPNPELFFGFADKNFSPQKLITVGKKIYFFSPLSENMFYVEKNKKTGSLMNIKEKFNFAANFGQSSVLLFSKPDALTNLEENGETSNYKITIPPDLIGFSPTDSSSYYSNFYFLDAKNGEILKCPFIKNQENQKCDYWLYKSAQKLENPAAFATDENIWVLTADKIEKFYKGKSQETLTIEVFPKLENPTKIFTAASLPYLYVLEPKNQRILIIGKKGEIVKQFQSEKFNDLKDFAVSNNGKTIYILNGLNVYQIGF